MEQTKLGGTFTYNEEEYIVIDRDSQAGWEDHEDNYCYGCAFFGLQDCRNTIHQECSPTFRDDCRDVVFKKVSEKIKH